MHWRPSKIPIRSEFAVTFLALLLSIPLCGCLSPSKKVAQNVRQLQYQWQTNVARQAALPEQILDWPQAVGLLEAGNLKLRRARADITNAQENVRQVFKDLMPTLNLRAGMSKTLETLPATSVDDVNFNLDSFFNIPGIVSMSTRLFATRLVLLRAKTYYELTVREQTIELYKLFLAFEDQAAAEAQLSDEVAFAQAIDRVDPFSGKLLMRDLDTRSIALTRDREGLQDKAGDLFGNRDWRWKLISEGLPQFRYDLAPLELRDTNRIAQVQLKLAAIECRRVLTTIYVLLFRCKVRTSKKDTMRKDSRKTCAD